MFIDKIKAIRRKWRITEKTLLSVSFIGGSLGSYLAMIFFRHKTNHFIHSYYQHLFNPLHSFQKTSVKVLFN